MYTNNSEQPERQISHEDCSEMIKDQREYAVYDIIEPGAEYNSSMILIVQYSTVVQYSYYYYSSSVLTVCSTVVQWLQESSTWKYSATVYCCRPAVGLLCHFVHQTQRGNQGICGLLYDSSWTTYTHSLLMMLCVDLASYYRVTSYSSSRFDTTQPNSTTAIDLTWQK